MKSTRSMFLLSTLTTLSLLGTNYTWNVDAGGNWDTATNWNPNGFPNSSADTVTFGNAIVTAPVNINVNGSFAVDSLTFTNTTNANYYGLNSSVGGAKLTLGNGTATYNIDVAAGVPLAQTNSILVPLVLANNVIFRNQSVATVFFSPGGISGAFGVTLQSGIFSFAGANAYTYTGTTTIQSGTTLQANSINGLPINSPINLIGTIDLRAFSNSILSLVGSGTVTNGGGSSATLTVNNGGTFTGIIQNGVGATALTLSGGTLTLSGANTYTGATTVAGGRLQANAANTFSSVSAVTLLNSGLLDLQTFSNTIPSLNGGNDSLVNIGSGATLTITNGGSFNGIMGGAGALTLSGGTLALSNINTHTGGTSVNGGTLQLLGLGSIYSQGSVSVAGTFDISGISSSTTIGSLTGAGTVNLGSKLLNVNPTSAMVTFSGNIQGASGSITKQGANTWQLSGNNSYTGTTTIAAGTLQAGSTTAFSPASTFTVTSILDLNGFSNTIGALNGSGTVTNSGVAATLTVANGGNYSGVIQNGASSTALTLTGGALTLTNANIYTGGTTISAGTLALSGNGQLATTGAVAVNGTFDISNVSPSTSITIGDLSGNGLIYLGNNTLISGTSTNIFFNGVMSDGLAPGTSGSFTKQGSGILTLGGMNTYTGTTTISAGTLRAGTALAFAPGTNYIVTGTLDLNNFPNSIESLNGTGTVTSSGNSGILTITDGGSFSGNISGTTAISVTGGTLTLTGTSNDYSGLTTISSTTSPATFQAGANNTFSPNSRILIQNGGALDLQTFSSTIKSLSGDGTTTVNISSGTLTIANGGTYQGIIGGAGVLELAGGTLALTNKNTYSGGTTIGVGSTLELQGAGALNVLGAVVASGTFDISGISGTLSSVSSLTGSGWVNLGAKSLFVNPASNLIFSGNIQGTNGSLFKVGSKTWTLSGNNTYSGGTTVSGGTLLAGSTTGFSPNSDFNVVATLDLNGFNNTINSLRGAGAVTNNGASDAVLSLKNGGDFDGTLQDGTTNKLGITVNGDTFVITNSANNTYSGPTTVNGAGVLQAGGANVFSTNSGAILNNTGKLDLQTFSNTIKSLSGTSGASVFGIGSTLTITNGSNGGAYAGSITGTLSLALTTGGTLTLSPIAPGLNTYSGATTIGSGTTLQAGSTRAFSANTAVTVTGTLDLNNFANNISSLQGAGSITTGGTSGILTVGNGGTFSGAITGAGGITDAGGTLQLIGNANNYTGPTTIQNGATLQAGVTNAFSASSDTTVAGTLDLNGSGSNTGNIINSLRGSGLVTNSGTAAATLSVANGGNFTGTIVDGTSPALTALSLTGGTLIASGANTYSGNTTLSNSAVLKANATNTFSPNTAFTLNGSSGLNLNSFNQTIFSLASASATTSVVLGTGILTINGGQTITFAGQISNAPCGGLTIDGGTNLTLTNLNNTYCGPTSVVNGTLQFGASGALSSTSDVTVAPKGTVINQAGFINLTNNFATAGTVTNNGTMYTNQFNITSGSLTTNNTGAFWYGTGSNAAINISGGTVNNTGIFGSNSTTSVVPPSTPTAIKFIGGTFNSNNFIYASTYTQGPGATLNLTFQNAPYGQVVADGNISVAGNLIVTAGGSFPISSIYPLLSTTGGVVTGMYSTIFSGFTTPVPRLQYSLNSIDLFFGGCINNWIKTSDGNWADDDNWAPDGPVKGGIPGINGNQNDVATLGPVTGNPPTIAITLANPTGTAAQSLTLFQLDFEGSNTSYTIQQFQNSAGTITFDANPTGTPQLIVGAGNHFIKAPLILNQNTELLLNDGTSVTLNSNTTLTSTTTQNFTVRQHNSATFGTGQLINNITLTPYSMLVASATVQNNLSITPTTTMTIGGITGQTSIVNNSTSAAKINPVGNLAIGGAGITVVNNSSAAAFMGSTGNGNIDSIGAAGTTTVNNSGAAAQFGPTGIGSNLLIGGAGTTTVNNNGAGAQFGPSGVGSSMTIQGSGTTINNAGLVQKLGAFGKGGNVSVTGGTVNNTDGALFQAGPSSTLSITGGTVNNDLTSIVGTTTSNISLTGGILNTTGNVVAYNYTQGGTGVLQINLTNDPTIIGNVAASGNATVGSTLILNALPPSQIDSSDIANLITGQRGVIGTYANIQYLNFPNETIPTVIYTPNAVQLVMAPTVTPNATGSLVGMPLVSMNEINFMIGKEMFGLHRRINKRKKTAENTEQQETAQLGYSKGVLLAEAEPLVHLAALGPQRSVTQSQVPMKESQLARKVVEEEFQEIPASRFYIGPTDNLGNFQSKGLIQRAFSYNTVGVFGGMDHAFENWGIGFAGDYGRTSATLEHHAGHFKIHQAHGSAYATWVPESIPDLAVDAIAGYAYDWYKTHRWAGPSMQMVKAEADPRGQAVDALLGVEYILSQSKARVMPQNLLFTPFFNVQYMWAEIKGYHEREADIYRLKVNGQQIHSLRPCLGIRLDYLVESKNVTFQPEISLAWQVECFDHPKHVKFSTLKAPNPQTLSYERRGTGRNTVIFGVNFLTTIYRVFEIEMGYDLQWNNLYKNNAFYVGIGGNF